MSTFLTKQERSKLRDAHREERYRRFADRIKVILALDSGHSVQDIADNYDTSITQLNRLLKKENTIALTLLKSVKKNIAIEMYEEGKSLDEISKRVGYSIRFVREKLL